MSYERRWKCEVCGEGQASIDWPKVQVCDGCMGIERVLSARMSGLHGALAMMLAQAYERGYEAGVKVERGRHGT